MWMDETIGFGFEIGGWERDWIQGKLSNFTNVFLREVCMISAYIL